MSNRQPFVPAPSSSKQVLWMQMGWLAFSSCLTLLAWHRIHTYVTGQDAATYIRIAHAVLDAGGTREALRAACSEVAPGYPLLLAAAIKVAGPFAPYFINPLLAVIALVFLWLIARRLSSNLWFPPLVLTGFLWILCIGDFLNAGFLLYPFRELPSLLLVFLGILWWLQALETSIPDRSRLVLSGGAFLAAAAFREPFGLALAGPAVYLLSLPRRVCIRALAYLLLLPVVAIVLSTTLVVMGITDPPAQLRGWFLTIAGRGNLGDHWIANLQGYARLFADEWGWALIAPGIVGIWFKIREGKIWAAFATPIIVLVAFYSTFELHKRYALIPLLLFAPFVAAGILALSDLVCRRFRSRWPRCDAVALTLMLLAANLSIAYAASQLSSWRPYVSRNSVRETVRRIDAAVGTSSVTIVSEVLCRTLGDLVLSYTRHNFGDAASIPAGGPAKPAFYFEPTNDEAFDPAKIRLSSHISARTIILDRADLVPLLAGDRGQPLTIGFGRAEFAIHRIAPWTNTCQIVPLNLPAGRPASLWLDFGSTPSHACRSIQLLQSNGCTVASWPSARSSGIHAVHVAATQTLHGPLRLEISSTSPLPAQPLFAIQEDDGPYHFLLGPGRRCSTLWWFHPPFLPVQWLDRHPIRLQTGGRLSLPPVYGSIGGINLTFEVAPRPRSASQVNFLFLAGGRVVTNVVVHAQGNSWIPVTIPPAIEGRSASLEIVVDSRSATDTEFVVKRLAIGLLPSDATSDLRQRPVESKR